MDKNDRIPPHQLEAEKQTIAVHIFTVSAGLVGACLTVIGLFRVIFKLKAIDSVATRLLAMDAMGFMLACLTAYLALRTAARPAPARRWNREFADRPGNLESSRLGSRQR